MIYHGVHIINRERFAAWKRFLTFVAKPRLKCLVVNFKRLPEKTGSFFASASLVSDSFVHSSFILTARGNDDTPNNSMDVRQKQRPCFRISLKVFLPTSSQPLDVFL